MTKIVFVIGDSSASLGLTHLNDEGANERGDRVPAGLACASQVLRQGVRVGQKRCRRVTNVNVQVPNAAHLRGFMFNPTLILV